MKRTKATHEQLVLDLLARFGPCCSDELVDISGMFHNQLAPVITRLLQAGLLVRVGTDETRLGRQCFVVALSEAGRLL